MIPAEREAPLPGDDLLPEPARVVNRAVTIKASPQQIYPCCCRSADKAGMYRHLVERLTGCEMAKDEVIRTEWQNLKETRQPDQDVRGGFRPATL